MCKKIVYLTIMMTVMLICLSWSLFFVKNCIDELEHPSLIISWTSNMNEKSYKEKSKEKHKP